MPTPAAIHQAPPAPPVAIPSGAELIAHLAAMPLADFLRDVYLRRPLQCSGTAAPWTCLCDEGLVDALLRTPGCDIAMARAGWLMRGSRPSSLEAERLLAATGAASVFRHVERWSSEFAQLAAALSEVLPGASDVRIQRTPAAAYGLGWHSEPEEALIMQVAGSTRYRLREFPLHPLPLAESPPLHGIASAGLSATHELWPGDWLYIPGGWWRVAVARSTSTVLSFGIRAHTALDVVRGLADGLLCSPAWRRRPPPHADHADIIDLCRGQLAELMAAMGGLLDDPTALADLLHRRAPAAPTPQRRAADDGHPV